MYGYTVDDAVLPCKFIYVSLKTTKSKKLKYFSALLVLCRFLTDSKITQH